jgi:hypothetical protein
MTDKKISIFARTECAAVSQGECFGGPWLAFGAGAT